jgi:molybdenum cofactor cytidylyltransferase
VKIGCVIPAAGFSRRFGAADKLTADIGGIAMIRRVCERVVASRVAVCLVAVRPEAHQVVASLLGLPISVVENPLADSGMGSSIAAGVAALDQTVTGAFVLPADMPAMTSEFLDELIARFEAEGCARIVMPETARGEQRNPVLWPRAYFPALRELAGEGGAKGLLRSLPDETVRRVTAADERIFADIDTLQDLADIRGGSTR